jgi:hypothetical protein
MKTKHCVLAEGAIEEPSTRRRSRLLRGCARGGGIAVTIARRIYEHESKETSRRF